IELFSVKDPVRAREIANRLDQLNAERQEEERRILDCIRSRFEEEPALHDAFCIVIDGDGWHRGVIGITATRVVERYGRPTIVLSRDGEEAHGSGRSIRGFHLLEALESCRELFSRFGGHAAAVGLGLPCDRIPELRAALDTYARGLLTLEDFVPTLDYDADILLDDVSPKLYESVQKLRPFGMGNPEPVFSTRGVNVTLPPKIIKDKHLKLRLSQPTTNGGGPSGNGRSWQAMAWRMAERVAADPLIVGDALDVAFTLELNDHPDFGGLELRVADYRRSEIKRAAVG
ncbi:MAG: DHHA1 domain-containing protein, partial [Terriglobales bacterium]